MLYTDTDSLIYELETEDFYQDIADDVEETFDTSKTNKHTDKQTAVSNVIPTPTEIVGVGNNTLPPIYLPLLNVIMVPFFTLRHQ